jgi:hypothetical protein
VSSEAGAGALRKTSPPVRPEVPQHSLRHPDLAIRLLGLLVGPSGDLHGRPSVARQAGWLACEVCRFDFAATYGNDLHGFADVHHLAPLSRATGKVVTTLKDLAILCANCHWAIHRIGPEMPGVEEMRRKLRGRRG